MVFKSCMNNTTTKRRRKERRERKGKKRRKRKSNGPQYQIPLVHKNCRNHSFSLGYKFYHNLLYKNQIKKFV